MVKIRIKELVKLSLEKIKPFQGGLKELSRENYEKLRNEIKNTGYNFAMHVWKDPKDKLYKLLDGHQRYRVLTEIQKEGEKIPELPCVVVDAPSYKEAKRMVLQGTSQYGKITGDTLYQYLHENGISHTELAERYNFHEIDIDRFISGYYDNGDPDKNVREDGAPNPPKKPKTKTGDLITLGNHRIVCGDSTKPDDVRLLMDGVKADMVFTDPPYGVGYEKKSDEILGNGRKSSKISGDDLSREDLEKIISGAFKSIYENIKDDASYYITSPQGGELGLMMMMMMMMQAGIQCRHCLIWVKNSPVFSMGRLDYDYQHEPILYGWKKKHHFFGKGAHTKSTWQINRPSESKLHPTMKPVELIENAVLNSTQKNMVVLDLFLGSGSTMIACEKTGRRCYGIEIDPVYCDVIVKRWAEYSGAKSILRNGKKEIVEVTPISDVGKTDGKEA